MGFGGTLGFLEAFRNFKINLIKKKNFIRNLFLVYYIVSNAVKMFNKMRISLN